MASYSWAMWLIKPAPAALPGWCELNGSQVSSEPSQIQTSEVGSCGRNRSPLLDQPGVCIRSYAHRPGTPVKQAIHFSLVGLSCRASCNISLNYFNLVPAEYGKAKINGTTQDILSLSRFLFFYFYKCGCLWPKKSIPWVVPAKCTQAKSGMSQTQDMESALLHATNSQVSRCMNVCLCKTRLTNLWSI